MSRYWCYVVAADGTGEYVEAESAQDAADELAGRYARLAREGWSGKQVNAQSEDMSETAESEI